MPSEPDNQTFINDAFISYSRKDKEFAARLQVALGKYKPPKGLNLPQRNLVVFRDVEDFTGTDYDASLEKHLKNSRKLIVICSPHARRSQYVNDEIRRFAQERGKENIITVLVSGIANNEAKPEQEEEKAFPEALFEFMKMSVAASYIGFDAKKDKVDKGDSWYTILANLYDLSRREIEARDRKRQIQTRNRWIAGTGIVIIILAVALIFALISRQHEMDARDGEAKQKNEAERQRDAAIKAQKGEEDQRKKAEASAIEAIKQRDAATRQRKVAEKRMRIAQAQQLATQSYSFRESLPQRSLLLAVASILRTSKADSLVVTAAEESLRETLSVTGGVPLKGYERAVDSVAFSPDGKRLASGSRDGIVRIWSLEDPKAEPILLEGHGEVIESVAFSPDGEWLASGNSDSTVRIWSVENPKAEPIVLSGHEKRVTSVVFSPDGRRLASGSADKTVRIWSLKGPKSVPTVFEDHERGVTSVAFSPDGKKLASGSEDKTVRIRSLEDSKAGLIVLRGHDNWVRSVAFSPDGKRLASGGCDNTVRIWGLDDSKAEPIVLRGHDNWVYSVAYSPDSKWLASGSWDRTIRIWSVEDPKATPIVLWGHKAYVTSVAFSPDGKRLATGGDDETIRIWSLEDPKAEPDLLRGNISVHFISFGKGDDRTARIWGLDDSKAEPIVLRGHENAVGSVAFSPDGKKLASGSADYTVRIWSLEDSKAGLIVLRGHNNWVRSVVFSPDGRRLASGSADKTVRIWSLEDPKTAPIVLRADESDFYTYPVIFGEVSSVAFSPNGKRIAAGRVNGIQIWSVENPTVEPDVIRDGSGSVAFSPDGKRLASRGGSTFFKQELQIRNLEDLTAKPVNLICGGMGNAILSVAFSPDGKKLASGSSDSTVRIWSVENPKAEPIVLKGHENGVTSVAFSSDGRRLASGSADNTVRIWSLKDSMALPVVLRGHEKAVLSVAFSPDGKRLASGSSDSTVRIWSLDLDKLCSKACEVAGRNLSCEEWQQFFTDEPYRAICPELPYPKDCGMKK